MIIGGARRDDFSAPVVDANIMPMKNDWRQNAIRKID